MEFTLQKKLEFPALVGGVTYGDSERQQRSDQRVSVRQLQKKKLLICKNNPGQFT